MKPGTLGALLASSLILHPSSFAWAAHPFITDDTGTQGKGNWQLELQGDLLRSERTADTGGGPVEQKRKVNAFVPVLSYGILDSLDIQLGLSYGRQRTTENGVETEDESGMSDSTLELKWRFLEAGALSLALKPGLLLPTGDETKGLGTGKTSWGVALLATYEAEPWTFLGNVAYSKARFKLPQDAADNESDLWRVSGGLSYAVARDFRLVGEAGLRRNESKNDPFLPDRRSQFAMIGFIYSPSKSMDFDAGFRKNLNDAEFDKAYLVGATFRW
ncbi:MAG TPA: transporter [Burkholderiales bacterium]|nr:transporter [Burkholderiales bacterium]